MRKVRQYKDPRRLMYCCLECGKEFEGYVSERKRGGAKFCSRECGYENKRRRVVFHCEICGKEMNQRQSEYNRSQKHHYCSCECSSKGYSQTKRGINHHCFGKLFTEEHKQKLSESMNIFYSDDLNRAKWRGENNPAWNGGTTAIRAHVFKQLEYKTWRKAVFERDNYICSMCGKRGNGMLHAHHILPFHEYPQYRFEVDNGITFCKECHDIFHILDKAHIKFQPLPRTIAARSEQSDVKHSSNSGKPLSKDEVIPSQAPKGEGVETRWGASLTDEGIVQTTNFLAAKAVVGTDARTVYCGNT